MPYSAKIKEARKEFSLPDNQSYLDIWFDILSEGKVIGERRLAFPLGTSEEAIEAEVKKYCQVYEEDVARAEKCEAEAKKEAEAVGVLSALKGREVK